MSGYAFAPPKDTPDNGKRSVSNSGGGGGGGGGITQAYQTVEEEGTPLTQRSTLVFTGAGVSAADTGGETVVTIPGSGGGGLPAGVVAVEDFVALAASQINAADSLTGWSAVNVQTAPALDTVEKIEGTASVKTIVWTGTGNSDLSTKVVYDHPSQIVIGAYAYVAVGFKWKNDGPGIGKPVEEIFAFKLGTAVGLGGTTVTVNIPSIPEDIWTIILIPKNLLTEIRSVGLITIGFGDLATNRAIVWMDDVRFPAATQKDVALASAATVAVFIGPTYIPTYPQTPRALGATKSVIDLRPQYSLISRHGGVRNLSEWDFPLAGEEDSSAHWAAVFSSLPPRSRLEVPPESIFLVDKPFTLNKSGMKIDFQGSRFYNSALKTYTGSGLRDASLIIRNCNNVGLYAGEFYGYRRTTFAGASMTTVAGTPVNVGFSEKELDGQNDECRTPLDINEETSYYARDKDGNNIWEFSLKDTLQVPNDCVIQIKNEAGVVRATFTIPALTAVYTLYRFTYAPSNLGEKLYATVKKNTAPANVITINGAGLNFVYGQVLYDNAIEFSPSILLETCHHILLEEMSSEGALGDAIQVSNDQVFDVTLDKCFSRGASRQGMSFNRGERYRIKRSEIREAHRSGIDIEPFSSLWFVRDVYLSDLIINNVRNNALALGQWSRVFNVNMDHIVVPSSRLGFVSGGCVGGTWSDLEQQNITSGAEYDFSINAQGLRVKGASCAAGFAFENTDNTFDDGSGPVVFSPKGNHAVGVNTKGKNYSNIKCIAADSSIEASNVQYTTDAWGSLTYVGQFQVANGRDFKSLNAGKARKKFPRTIKGVADDSPWYPQGLNLRGEPIHNVRGISGIANRKSNNFSGVRGGLFGTTEVIAFPVQSIPLFSSHTLAGTTGGVLTLLATQRYRLAPRLLYGGPRLADIEKTITLTGGNNAVNHAIGGWGTEEDVLISGFTLYHKEGAAGPYTSRFDFMPNEPFYSINFSGTTFKHTGTAVELILINDKVWGYPTTIGDSPSESLVPADESGFEPDGNYVVILQPNWDTKAWATSVTKTGFTMNFDTAWPFGGIGGSCKWVIIGTH